MRILVKFGFVLPFGDARFTADCAAFAEKSGWDGLFIWEPVWGNDPWVCLTAAAMVTNTIKLGTMLTPLPVLSPWKVASETATLDNLSGGRVILSVGLGAVDTGFGNFGLPVDRKIRAERLDEGLAVLTGLWNGQPFKYEGKHYQIEPTNFQPPPKPVQQPRIPIWVVGAWPSMKSMQRVLKYDGVLPNFLGEDGRPKLTKPVYEEIQTMTRFIQNELEAGHAYDIVMEGKTIPGNSESLGIVSAYQSAGATWWVEACWDTQEKSQVIERIQAGPPRI